MRESKSQKSYSGRRTGEEELLALRGRFVEETDALEALALRPLGPDVLAPRVVWVLGDVLARDEARPLGAVAVGGVAAAGLQTPRSVAELAEDGAMSENGTSSGAGVRGA
jgi:hypothetical protein